MDHAQFLIRFLEGVPEFFLLSCTSVVKSFPIFVPVLHLVAYIEEGVADGLDLGGKVLTGSHFIHIAGPWLLARFVVPAFISVLVLLACAQGAEGSPIGSLALVEVRIIYIGISGGVLEFCPSCSHVRMLRTCPP